MRTSGRFLITAALVLFAGISAILFFKYRQSDASLTSLKAENEETRTQYSEALTSISSIQDSLNAIVLGDEAVRLTNSSYMAEHRLTQSQGDAVMERIGLLRAGVERSKARIQELDDNLRKSGVKIDGLEKMLISLKRSVVKKEQMIAQLSGRVDSLQTEVHGLTATVTEKQRELGTVYCLVGDKKELTTSGAVVATGGLFGIGKTLKPTGQVDETICTTLNTDEEATLDIAAPKVMVLSAQSATSYQLEPNGDHTTLRIIDPVEFRKIRHLVVLKLTA